MPGIVAIHQPNYIPWLGYFYKIYKSDIFVFLDDVQFSNSAAHHYHYIKTPKGPQKLKIPIRCNFKDPINQVYTKDENGWKERHMKALEENYRESPHFEEVFSDFSGLLEPSYINLAELNSTIVQFIINKLNIEKEFIFSSDLGIQTSREERILDICEALGASVYYSGKGAKAYQQEENFIARNIKLVYDTFSPVKYPQLGTGFQANVTILDYLMNCGYDWPGILEKIESGV